MFCGHPASTVVPARLDTPECLYSSSPLDSNNDNSYTYIAIRSRRTLRLLTHAPPRVYLQVLPKDDYNIMLVSMDERKDHELEVQMTENGHQKPVIEAVKSDCALLSSSLDIGRHERDFFVLFLFSARNRRSGVARLGSRLSHQFSLLLGPQLFLPAFKPAISRALL